jgi:hypothetical protein
MATSIPWSQLSGGLIFIRHILRAIGGCKDANLVIVIIFHTEAQGK